MTVTATWTLGEAEAKRLSDVLFDTGVTADMTEAGGGQWIVAAYFEADPDPAWLRRIAKAVLGRTGAPVVARLPDEDWVAKSLRQLAPVRAGRFLVHGRHDRERRRASDIAIEIEANRAFGTGHHGTTAGCLTAMSDLAKRWQPRSVLDVGTGSGVLAIAAAKLWRAPVIATDIDPTALAIAKENIAKNGVARYAKAVVADGLDHPLLRGRRYDLVVANILAGPLVRLAPAIAAHLAPGGILILSGLLTSQRRTIQAAYRAHGLVIKRAAVGDGWLTLVLATPTP